MDRQEALRHFDFAKELKPTLEGPRPEAVYDRLEAQYGEMRAALVWFTDNGDTEKGLMLASLLWRYWMDKGHVEDGRQLMARLLEMSKAKPSTTRADALYGAGMLAFRQGDNLEADKIFQECLMISREKNHRPTVVKALTGQARVDLRNGKYAEVRAKSEEARAIARDMQDAYGESRPLHMLAAATRMEGDLGRARELYEESLALARKLGDELTASVELDNLGSVALHMGDVDLAKDRYRQAAELSYKMRSMYMLPYMPLHFSMVALEEGKLDRAVKLLGASEALFESAGMVPDPDERVEWDRTASRLRNAVDADRHDRLWAEGRRLSLDQAVRYSLET